MNRRKIIIGAGIAGATIGVGALAGLAAHSGVLRADEDDDDDNEGGREVVARGLRFAKVSLQQGFSTSEREGLPISGKFEVNHSKFQLSVYTSRDGKFSEVLVDYSSGEITNVAPITAGEDLAEAELQSAAMARAKTSLRDAVAKALVDAGDFHAIGVAPSLKNGRAVASVLIVKGDEFKVINQPLE
jgi:hypothetical protein